MHLRARTKWVAKPQKQLCLVIFSAAWQGSFGGVAVAAALLLGCSTLAALRFSHALSLDAVAVGVDAVVAVTGRGA